jgi:hypothetical protein
VDPEFNRTVMPGGVVTASGTRVITQADLDAGHVSSAFAFRAEGPGGDPASLADDVHALARLDVALGGGSGLVATQRVEASGLDRPWRAGDRVEFEVTVTNTAGVPVLDVAADTLELEGWEKVVGVLGPGASARARGTHVVTSADADAGHLALDVTVHGRRIRETSPDGVPSLREVTEVARADIALPPPEPPPDP